MVTVGTVPVQAETKGRSYLCTAMLRLAQKSGCVQLQSPHTLESFYDHLR